MQRMISASFASSSNMVLSMGKFVHENTSARRLYICRLIHSREDMGGLKEELSRLTKEKIGRLAYERRVRLVEEFWYRLERFVREMDIRNIKIYQDGLPAIDEQVDNIVEQTARKGSRNYKLLKDLKERGGVIVGTEDPELLKKEYELLKLVVESSSSGMDQHRSSLKELLIQRDKFIAKRIDETLYKGERGLLFIGAMHRVENYLPRDIEFRTIHI